MKKPKTLRQAKNKFIDDWGWPGNNAEEHQAFIQDLNNLIRLAKAEAKEGK